MIHLLKTLRVSARSSFFRIGPQPRHLHASARLHETFHEEDSAPPDHLVIEECLYTKQRHNLVSLIGNLGRDPDYAELASGARLAHLALAVQHPGNPTTWVEVKAWHDLADAAARQLRRRDQIQVEGYLATYTTPAGYSRMQVYAHTIRKLVKSLNPEHGPGGAGNQS